METDSVYDDIKRERGANLYGENGKTEDHASFIGRMHEGARRVKQIGETVFAYEPARAIDTSRVVSNGEREIQRLGINISAKQYRS